MKSKYRETLKYEFSPCLECVVCGTFKDSISEADKVKLLREFYTDLELGELSEDIIKQDKDGFNLRRPILRASPQKN